MNLAHNAQHYIDDVQEMIMTTRIHISPKSIFHNVHIKDSASTHLLDNVTDYTFNMSSSNVYIN